MPGIFWLPGAVYRLLLHKRSYLRRTGWTKSLRRGIPVDSDGGFIHEDGHYCRSIQDLKERFHLVIIDGRDRVNCVRYCPDHLTADGVVILDDSHREKYSDAFTIMRDLGFRELTFSGIKPGEYSRHDTTVFYRDGNCIGF